MKLYVECHMGAAGDMLAAALLDLFEDKQAVVDELNRLSLPHTQIACSPVKKGGIGATRLTVTVSGEQELPDSEPAAPHRAHRTLRDIRKIIEGLQVSDRVRKQIIEIYTLVAEAEAQAHRLPVGEVHFHELGMLDAIADIAVCACLLDKLQPESVICSPINVGNGTVRCAHGILPVPTPATAALLRGVPYYKSGIQTELCTPTGAAVLTYYADAFTDSPAFGSVSRIGVGAGTKELEQPNVLRVFASEDADVTELACNIDDMTGEEAAFAAERMLAAGALDCFITPVLMKKGRPGYLFTVLCRTAQADAFAKLIFKHTATIGIRQYTPSRYRLDRTVIEEAGTRIKRAEGYGVTKEKIEFEDIARLAREKDISVFEAREILKDTE